MTDTRPTGRKLRLLVAIASHGEKNLGFLKGIIETYRGMSLAVEVVVLSDAPKELGAGVKVVVGLPSKNPWSLPFAHKAVFAENVERYDLFVYSEDDMDVTEGNIQAFVRATAAMGPDEIAGYLRYEVCGDGTKLLTDVHGAFHWRPETVQRRGGWTSAEFTNEHAGFYILTQAQLRRAMGSGGFLQSPYEGRYGLPETAATDPYTCCGFRKVICISALEDFLIRHMSNLYVNRHGVSLSAFEEQVQTLLEIRDGLHPASRLCEVESKMIHGRWSKSYYEEPSEDLLSMVPGDAECILSIGSGWGATEAKLKERGARVTALPLDSVIGAAAARRGIEVIYGAWEECLGKLRGRKFDAVVITNLLHLRPDPGRGLEEGSEFVGDGGSLVLSGPNFERMPTLVKRTLGINDERKLRRFDESGISVCGPRTLARHLRKAGLRVAAVQWLNHKFGERKLRKVKVRLGRLTARDWILQARR